MSGLKKYIAWFVLALAGIAVTSAYFCYKKWECDWYRQKIPTEVKTGDVVLIDGESHFREGCGVAIFKLAEETQSKIATLGLAALEPPVSSSGVHLWSETPYSITGDGLSLEDRWMEGTGCARMDSMLSKSLSDSLSKPGSFVRKLYEAAVIVIPSEGLVAFVYSG